MLTKTENFNLFEGYGVVVFLNCCVEKLLFGVIYIVCGAVELLHYTERKEYFIDLIHVTKGRLKIKF